LGDADAPSLMETTCFCETEIFSFFSSYRMQMQHVAGAHLIILLVAGILGVFATPAQQPGCAPGLQAALFAHLV
jgi:hypothetical protein